MAYIITRCPLCKATSKAQTYRGMHAFMRKHGAEHPNAGKIRYDVTEAKIEHWGCATCGRVPSNQSENGRAAFAAQHKKRHARQASFAATRERQANTPSAKRYHGDDIPF